MNKLEIAVKALKEIRDTQGENGLSHNTSP